jgi:hypothetical protein
MMGSLRVFTGYFIGSNTMYGHCSSPRAGARVRLVCKDCTGLDNNRLGYKYSTS